MKVCIWPWQLISPGPGMKRAMKGGLCTWLLLMVLHQIGYGADSAALLPTLQVLLLGNETCGISIDRSDAKYDLSYKGLQLYTPQLTHLNYRLPQLTDREFNALTADQRRLVADKLLSSLFFGYGHEELEESLNSGAFLCSVRKGLTERKNAVAELEEYILDDEYFFHQEYYANEVHDILARLYAMEYLDEYFLHNWMAYILTQTILFSPAYELDSSHLPDVANVYNWLVMDMEDDVSMRYSGYLHMTSLENWRRFRSPEDNGREMLEIFALDFDDTKVPQAALALQNWFLDEDHDTLVIGLNENSQPFSMFGATVLDGFDLYREIVKSASYQKGVTRRLVDFFFTTSSEAVKQHVTNTILSSQPERWQDILLQIVFSKEYLLEAEREKSAEELFYSLARKLPFKHNRYTFRYFNNALDEMNQASMKYKLGKLERTPLDTLSFAHYHQFIREDILLNSVCGEGLQGYEGWSNDGWTPTLTAQRHFSLIQDEPADSMRSFIGYFFIHFLQRQPTSDEIRLFFDHMLNEDHSRFNGSYNLWNQDDEGCYYGRRRAAENILDYISRLSEFYWMEGVQQ